MRYLVSFITFFLILILLSIFSILIIEMYIGHELSDRDLESVRMKLLSLIELSFSFLLTRFLVKKGYLPFIKKEEKENLIPDKKDIGQISASLLRRYLAFQFDTIFLLLLLFACARLITLFEAESQFLQALLLLPLYLYDVLFVYFFGATPGHYLAGLRVVSASGSKLTLANCCLRSWLKFALWIFFWIALIGKRKQMPQDYLTSTYVVYSKKIKDILIE
ncbi:hypothetical protein EHQ27_10730 [Leptospira wolffii]|uniref:RDD family protein n=1 Tax=Leptospira wolffii TaxID=409998 RepID=UPI0010847CEC|nr:RDD family protein [Leptospira wolffii]TGK56666.1 hypothetical protein EHQ32_13800 [Leptospira wolffii]TGK71752.1 hypothetical protein EHQ27_10730 [Leptospira wolffii]TGK75391.1 hypothetical protein EHQ35_03175 [Leptospira wolffii]TGL33119.1 hypothetical protein EHQ57_01355 [Leptospira wolffii]